MGNEGKKMKKKHDFSGDTGTYALPFLQYLDSFLIFLKRKKKKKMGSGEKNDGRGNKKKNNKTKVKKKERRSDIFRAPRI